MMGVEGDVLFISLYRWQCTAMIERVGWRSIEVQAVYKEEMLEERMR
jgi:hypothetical protein